MKFSSIVHLCGNCSLPVDKTVKQCPRCNASFQDKQEMRLEYDHNNCTIELASAHPNICFEETFIGQCVSVFDSQCGEHCLTAHIWEHSKNRFEIVLVYMRCAPPIVTARVCVEINSHTNAEINKALDKILKAFRLKE